MIALTPTNWPKTKLNRWQQLFTAEQYNALPPLYSQDGKGAQAVAVVKYFAGSKTWFASEFCPETGTFFGYVVNHAEPECSEWGYFLAEEISASQVPTFSRGPRGNFRIIPVVERDLSFRPQTIAAAVLAAGGPDLAAGETDDALVVALSEPADDEQAARDAFDAQYADTAATVMARQETRDRAAAPSPPPAAGLDASEF